MTFKKRHETLTISMLIGACFALLLSSFSSFARQCEELPLEVLRLHVLAHSDSEDDQRLKYLLRDELMDVTKTYFAGAKTLEEAARRANLHIMEIETRARDYLAGLGYDYDVSISLDNMFFTTRVYENVTMPAGNYLAMQVKIGSGEGKNWWCVIFPPLCLPACTESSKEPFFSEEASKTIENGESRVEVRFRIFEWFASLFR
jgi:stage II sporulation protein R